LTAFFIVIGFLLNTEVFIHLCIFLALIFDLDVLFLGTAIFSLFIKLTCTLILYYCLILMSHVLH